MMDFLQYDARVAVLIAAFYMFYRLLLSKDSLHRLNRVVLLSTAIASFLLPFCVITLHRTEVVVASPAQAGEVAASHLDAATADIAAVPWWEIALPIAFWLGFGITLLFTLISILRVCILINKCELHPQADGITIAVAKGEVAPFSWMNYIVLSRKDFEEADEAILLHEQGHIRRHHSVDVLLVDILTSLQWFNPAMWMLRSDLRAIHEYEADAAVLSHGINARQYQYLLIRKAMVLGGYSVANGINHSTLKQRIAMMQNNNNNRYSWLKALYVLPIVAISLATSAKTVTNYLTVPASESEKAVLADTDNRQQISVDVQPMAEEVMDDKTEMKAEMKESASEKASEKAVEKESLIEKTSDESASMEEEEAQQGKPKKKVFDVVEVMPSYKGGFEALKKYLSTYKIPQQALAKDLSGRILVRFVISKDGSVSDVSVMRSSKSWSNCPADIAAALDAEAVRLVKAMPAWNPGTQKGKPVDVSYMVPIAISTK